METCEFRAWDELLPDALGLIFRNLSLEELLTVAPRVCKSWRKVVMGPYCWQEIDIEKWSENSRPENLDRMVQMLVMRSCGSFQKLSVSGLNDDTSFSLIADHARALQTLRLPRSEISSSIMEQAVSKLSTLTFLDISYCRKIGAGALEAIGKHCKSLTTLHRNMNPWETMDKLSQDDEALAIAATMPKLQHLEISHLLVNTPSVVEIVSKCQKLESLDVRGCWSVRIEKKFLETFPGLKVVGPPFSDGWNDSSGNLGYMAWDFVAGEMDDYFDFYDEVSDIEWEDYEGSDEDADMWFYDGVEAVDASEFDGVLQ